MKQKVKKLLLLTTVLFAMSRVMAYDFTVDGIYYDVVSFTDLTCKVAEGDTKYKGDIVIPGTVNYANKTLTVVGINDYVFNNCSDLTGITIPNTISSIGDDMFYNCN